MSLQRTFIVVFLGLFWACSGNSLPAQSAFEQNVWETLPVFHNGRVMPLHTFAQQTVREICGTTRPYIIWDDAIIAEFNKIIEVLRQQSDSEENDAAIKYRFLNPNQNPLDGGFNRNYSVFDASNQAPPINTVLSIQGLDRARVERIAKRIRQLVPPEGRYFTADEILLSWVCEPEVWTYIPLFLVRESDYLDEMFGISFKDDARTSQYRVSLYQLENSPRYKQRCADIRRRQELGQITKNPIPFDQITERLENQVRLFRELTFHPYRQRPDRMLSLLNQAVGMSAGQSPYSTALDAWSYLLALGEVPGRQSTERSANSEEGNIFHPTTQRWHDIADKLHLLMSAYQQSDSSGNAVFPNPLIVEEQYENLIKLLDTNLAESAALMESIYTDVAYRTKNDPVINIKQLLPRLQAVENQSDTDQIRRIIISYYYSVKKLRKAVEAAYLALYDNGLSLRFLPMRSTLSLESTDASDHFGVPPWASAQMILGSGDTFVKRFFDPQLQSVTTGLPVIAEENETIDISEDAEENIDESTETSANEDAVPETSASETAEVPKSSSPSEQTKQSEEQLLFLPFTMESGILSMNTEGSGNLIDSVRNNIRILFASYSSLGGAYGSSDFAVRMQQFQYAVRHAAVQIETYRESLTEEGDEHYIKTAYPESERKLLAEYRYDRLNPFFWMWFFALLAVLFNVGAYIAAITRSKSAVARTIRIHSVGKSGENQEKELQDYTNSVEEWLFIGSVAMLICSIFIAFVGGVMRASITGWAPITNMYETVVMMAFSTAVLGLWYALHPFLHPALQWAWACSQFPSLSTLQNWLSARKEKRLAQTHHETSGEVVSPEMAEDFGLPEGVPLGVHSPVLILTPAEIEAQHHVEIARRKMLGQILMLIPRLLLSFGVFYFIVLLANGEYVSEHGFTAAAVNMFAATDMIDLSVVIASVFLLVWIIPHVLLMLILIPIALLFPSWLAAEKGIRSYEVAMIVEGSEHPAKQQSAHTVGLHHSEMSGVFHGETRKNEASDTSGAAWLTQVRNAVLNRKLFIAVTALIVFVAGLAASLNRVEFNPDIRPIAAVLRSNFWLTVHVIAIVVSYAAAFVAWGMAVISLGYVIFGRYLREPTDVSGQKVSIRLPATCQMFSPVIERLLRIALLLLVVGTVLGARWADYSWGRFWSWDPKEVWALITILFYVVVFHGRIARYYGIVGITVGALFASIAVIITWYGINFVFKGSVHSYGGGAESNAAIFLGTFIAANVLWGALALLRYSAEVYDSESAA